MSFLGGEADYGYDSSMILVECTDCYTATAMYMSQDIAAKKWNTRTTDSDLTTVTKQRDELELHLGGLLTTLRVKQGLTKHEAGCVADGIERLLSTINEQKGSN